MNSKKNQHSQNAKVYLIGSGMSALASAIYLEKDAGVPGKNIHIFEKDNIPGGACDGAGNKYDGFIIRGGRMHEMHYECYWELLSLIPSLENPNISVRDESYAFNERFVSNAQARLLKEGKKLDVSSYGLSLSQQADFLKLTFMSERSLKNKQIQDWFEPSFFETKLWLIWTSMFAFQKWSSLAEMRRYMKRFIHLVDGLHRLGGIMRTKYNQYDSVIRPMKKYLEEKGINFNMGKEVIDIDFDFSQGKKTATALHFKDNSQIQLEKHDVVFFTNGSITDSTDSGTWDTPAQLKGLAESSSWQLWKKIAAKDAAFGNPSTFCDNIDLQKWYSFTATLKDPTFHDYMENFSGNVDGTGGLVTLTDSNWLMSFVIARQPHFPNQPDDVKVFWGYGLYADKKGNYIDKTMAQCSGAEILQELYYHLKIQDLMKPISDAGKVNCIPVAMPFVDSLFMPRELGDRPDVIPKGSTNFAFIGQFAEAPKDCVFTVEYSVRTAQIAVYGLFDTDKEVHPMYDSAHNPKYLIAALKAISR
ncbi:67 kDa myosin-cross-reactive antigen family protein [Psychromonas ingrahamii 37]|uniref:67 kDa myosin-cross-reactive antigen family protein n=1 Tax=Psychromonas ingrahamii (strain DSM 17664 / CCUG 51855 / 37) TaxID=357804 RepID=A1SYJ7_PSYIN|nr:oleate hydratase [Psychromonas ingrahamii]ABM04562.1 67 kDa myosin-cross-reactive antigen family protein [Psychromonas ingrahamii 37]